MTLDWGTVIAGIFGLLGIYLSHLLTAHAKKKEIKQAKELADRNAFGPRKKVDSSIPLDERVRSGLGIKKIRILNYCSNTILTPQHADAPDLKTHNDLERRIKEVLGEGAELCIMITAPDSEAAKEAVKHEKVINQKIRAEHRIELFYSAYASIQQAITNDTVYKSGYTNQKFQYRLTDVALPYALFQVIYEDPAKNHIKLDLYSPYITSENERRTIYLYESKNYDDYTFFSQNLDDIWNNSITRAEEEAKKEAWLKHNKVIKV